MWFLFFVFLRLARLNKILFFYFGTSKKSILEIVDL